MQEQRLRQFLPIGIGDTGKEIETSPSIGIGDARTEIETVSINRYRRC